MEGMTTMRVKLTFIDEVLGTAANDPEIHETYIASKAPDAQIGYASHFSTCPAADKFRRGKAK